MQKYKIICVIFGSSGCAGAHPHFNVAPPLDTSLLKKLKITLLSLQAVMNDAEEKQITNPAVKQWLDELRDALYDADDLLDEINTESLRCKLEAESHIQQPFSDQVLNFLSSPFKSFFRVVNSEIQDVFQRLEQFSLQKDILGLKQSVCGKVWHGIPTSSVVDESAIYGRDDDRKKLKRVFTIKRWWKEHRSDIYCWYGRDWKNNPS